MGNAVYVVTGANTGLGKEVSQILYSKNAKVYLAARSEEKAKDAIAAIQAAAPDSKGDLVYLHLDLADLTTIKASANEFLSKEAKLHVLFNNAGVMTPPQGSKTAQGYEMQLGTNNLGHFLFTKLLTPTLVTTAKTEPANTVRVVWVSSSAAELGSHNPGGVDMSNLDYHDDKGAILKYGISKAGNFLQATELARRYGSDGVVSVALNPGNLGTDLSRHVGILQMAVIKLLVHPPILGAYTELFAAFSPEVTVDSVKKDNWVVPWGRFAPMREDIDAASRPTSEGGTGLAEKWWQWNEEQVKPYV
ncbi:short chain dehydrogenase reductase [Grosmannia clavigera kw1407]|uniref:Short chain dehydrogenase reductase n=1 Tax=Grosmannia clavigera (strain kw1407 / UAMH 11150) TaxID=655863 RepID=F0XKM0_GROCL|nr:short chain dehydrogenase reductase [Grosmannia clavigera kw1407]EFX01780.1 short chain dehydrogenase reductase [Grosmannia clavigera kw1407]